jgi:hypothetical protein
MLEPIGDELHLNALPLLPRLAQAYLDMDKVAEAEAAAHRAVERAAEMQYRLVLVDALRVRALIAARGGRYQEATHDPDEALTLCRVMPYPYGEAKALWVYGHLEANRGELVTAQERFMATLAICEQLGERMYAERIEHELEALDTHMN